MVFEDSLKDTTCTVLLNVGTYSWRVRARNKAGFRSRWQEFKKLVVSYNVSLASPEDEESFSGASPVSVTFSWSSLPDAVSYNLIISKSSSFTDIFLDENTSSTSYRVDFSDVAVFTGR